jgi:hypothetical protein
LYTVTTDDESGPQIAALPAEALAAWAEARVLLEVNPWASDSYNRRNPDAPLRSLAFGSAGMAIYLILEDLRRVDVVRVVWGM